MKDGGVEIEILQSQYFRLLMEGKSEEFYQLIQHNIETVDALSWQLISQSPYTVDQLNQHTSELQSSFDHPRDVAKIEYYHHYFKYRQNFDPEIHPIRDILEFAQRNQYDYLLIITMTKLAYLYTWQGRIQKAAMILDDAQFIYESSKLPSLASNLCGFRLYAEVAQGFRHLGKFDASREAIIKSKKLAEKTGNDRIVAWVVMVKVGIETEMLFSIPEENIISTRKIIKQDIDEIKRRLQSKPGIDNYLQVARYQYLKTSIRNRERVDAERIIWDILESDTQHWIHKIDAAHHLADLLVEEYRLYESAEVFDEILQTLDYIQVESEKRNSPLFLVKAKVIEAKLMEVTGEFDEAFAIYNSTKKLVSEYKLGMLQDLIEYQERMFEKNYFKMKELVNQNATIDERMELNQIQNYIKKAQSRFKLEENN